MFYHGRNDKRFERDYGARKMTELIPASCPSCGANLRLPDIPGKAQCQFCGKEIIISQKVFQATVPCPKCDGYGTVSCSKCHSTYLKRLVLYNRGEWKGGEPQKGRCADCYGTGLCPSCDGKHVCDSCSGSGKCRTCGGSGRHCSSCHGSTRCRVCKGRGRILKFFTCSHCGGTGVCGFCHGKVVCDDCSGSGQCSACDGSGKCPDCDKNGFCSHCLGTGVCPDCGGQDKQKCPACSGSGRI
jgi:hypothetical protein